jgi:predicted esterase
MKSYLAILLLMSVSFAAPAATTPTPGALTEYNVELPRELRQMAGRGQLSPVAHALVTIALPHDIDMAHEWPIMVISATSDPSYNSSRGLLHAYAEVAMAAGWILVAADPVESITAEQDDVPMRLALATAALAVLDKQRPASHTAPLAFGGFSGGAKYSEWLAASFAKQGRNIIGIYLAGINADTLVEAAQMFDVLTPKFKRTPVFLQTGIKDAVATPEDHARVAAELKLAGFRNIRIESFDGAHEIQPAPLAEALVWFRQFTLQVAPAK